MAEKFKTKPKVLLGPGHWKAMGGMVCDKTEADFREMEQNFKELSERGLIPGIAPGHDDDSPSDLALPANDTGAPLLGIAGNIWWDPAGNRLMTYLDELQEPMATDIKDGKYRSLSAVIKDHWWDGVEGRYRDNVITEIGVLGAKWPGYGDQPDRLEIEGAATRMADTGGDGAKVYRLSMADMEVAPDNGGGEDVEDKERKGLEATIEELKAKIVELEAAAPDEEKESLKAELAEVKEKLELAAKAKAAADEKIAEAEKDAKKVKVDEALTGLVTADDKGNVKATPAETDALRPTMMAMDDSKTIKLAEGEDGEDVMGSELDRYIATFEHRPVVLKLAEKGVDDSDKLHKGKEPEKKSALSDMDREIAVKCGLDPDEVERVNAPGYDPHADVAAAQAKRDEK